MSNWSMIPPRNKQPILVTGAIRSGTTWVGKMLSHGGETIYVSEPFNYNSFERKGGKRYRLVPYPFRCDYQFLTDADIRAVTPYLRYRMVLQHPFWADFKDQPGLRRLLGACWRKCRSCFWQVRPLVKDPYALMSAAQLARNFGMEVVVLIRHPAAFVSSMKRLKWQIDVGKVFLAQEELMNGYLAPLAKDIETFHLAGGDIIENAILHWRITHHVISMYKQKHPDWIVLRHEDMSRDPVREFGDLYKALSLSFSEQIGHEIESYCGSFNPAEANGQIHQLHRNSSENVWNWKHRLSADEISRVRRGVEDIASQFYSSEDW